MDSVQVVAKFPAGDTRSGHRFLVRGDEWPDTGNDEWNLGGNAILNKKTADVVGGRRAFSRVRDYPTDKPKLGKNCRTKTEQRSPHRLNPAWQRGYSP